jgi:hypothetical protein
VDEAEGLAEAVGAKEPEAEDLHEGEEAADV